MVWDAGFRVKGARLKVQGSQFKFLDLGFKLKGLFIKGSRIRSRYAGFMIRNIRSRVEDSESRV
jgi:hypothetical protein